MRCLAGLLLLCLRLQASSSTCYVEFGKPYTCKPILKARPFAAFLTPQGWGKHPSDDFAKWFQFVLSVESGPAELKMIWREVGMLGSFRIREVRFYRQNSGGDGTNVAGIVVAEQAPDQYAPLFIWNSYLSTPFVILHSGGVPILFNSVNFSGNVPSYQYWIWTVTADGPVRLDFYKAMARTVGRVGKNYGCYSPDQANWKTLEFGASCWTGPQPRKTEVHLRVSFRLAIRDATFVTESVKMKDFDLPGRPEPGRAPAKD
jgi:hypothetical protein